MRRILGFDRVCRIGRVLYFAIRGKRARVVVDCPTEEEIMRIDATDILRRNKIAGGVHFFL